MSRSILLVVALCLMSSTAAAQKVEVYGGVQYTHLEPHFNGLGWNLAVTGNFKHVLGITADVSGTYPRDLNALTYTVGPVLTARLPVLQPFVHALFGGITFTTNARSNTGFAMLLGGGVDLGWRQGIGFRLVQIDWLHTRLAGNTSNKNTRVSAGLVLKF